MILDGEARISIHAIGTISGATYCGRQPNKTGAAAEKQLVYRRSLHSAMQTHHHATTFVHYGDLGQSTRNAIMSLLCEGVFDQPARTHDTAECSQFHGDCGWLSLKLSLQASPLLAEDSATRCNLCFIGCVCCIYLSVQGPMGVPQQAPAIRRSISNTIPC